jgi:hypothetical protein
MEGGYMTNPAHPPDTCGAVGKNLIMAMHNQGVHIQTKTGTTIYVTNSLKGFWTDATNIGAYFSIYDPRVVYDPFHDRWLASATIDSHTTGSAIVVGASVSSDPHPTNGWHFARVKADTNNLWWADQPTLGFNKDWIVVQANMITFPPSLQLEASYFFVINKTNFYAGGPGYTNAVRLCHSDPQYCGNERPAVTYDDSLEKIYLIQNADGNFEGNQGRLRLFSISGPVDAPILNYTNGGTNAIYITVSNSPNETVTWANNLSTNDLYLYTTCCSPQLGTNKHIGTAPDARFDNVLYRNGSLWCAHTIFLPASNVSRSAVQWWQLNPDNPAAGILRQRGRVDDASGVNFYAYPSIGVNQFGDVLLGYSSFSTNQYASANYSFRSFYYEANKMCASYRYREGEDVCVENSWGDYSATVVDPANDTDLWTIQEYAEESYPISGMSWGTEWAHVAVLVPTNDQFSASLVLSGMSG